MSGEAQPSLPHGVLQALEALVAGDGITEAWLGGGRHPDSLSYPWAPVSEVRLRLVTGFPVPRLSPRAVAGRCEVLAVPGRDGEPFFDVDERGRPSTSVFAVFYLPQDLDWRHAAASSVLREEVTHLYAHLPMGDRPWPQSVAQRLDRFNADGSPRPSVTDDFTVVEVDGTSVGVQVDRSGAACLGWSIHRSCGGAGQVWNVTMMTRGSAVEVVHMVREAGLLQ
ncbi:hypothetical protein [Kineococcus sp. SYSU DK002]|uniref:hypothetical protein n=1 Tax=Kineococcus sp. SYSU DK002 TaxID=3383123 RepID=UPI003D7C875C